LSSNASDAEISVVIPAYNEARAIRSALQSVAGYFRSRGLDGEIVVVDDGSSDATATLARETDTGGVPVEVVVNETNRGKGYSVRRGILLARGRCVGFADADMSTPIEELDKVREALAGGADVAIGSRAMALSQIAKHQPWWRERAGRFFGFLVRRAVLPGIWDSQCGFKFFSRTAAREIFSRQKLSGWAFDVELLYLARRLGYQIAQIPVSWVDEPNSKVKMLHDGPKMALDVLRIRYLHRGLKVAVPAGGDEDR